MYFNTKNEEKKILIHFKATLQQVNRTSNYCFSPTSQVIRYKRLEEKNHKLE